MNRKSKKGMGAIARLEVKIKKNKLDPHRLIHEDIHSLPAEELHVKALEIIEKTEMPLNISIDHVANAVSKLMKRGHHVTRVNIILEAMDHMGYKELKETFGLKRDKVKDKKQDHLLIRESLIKVLETQGEIDIGHWKQMKAAHDAIRDSSGVDVFEPSIEAWHPSSLTMEKAVKSMEERKPKRGYEIDLYG